MAYSEQARRKAIDTIQARRMAAAAETERRRADFFAQYPALEMLDNEMKAIGLATVKAALGGESKEIQASMESRLAELQKRQQTLLAQNGLHVDALEPHHFCARCHDSGLAPDGGSCECVLQILRKQARAEISNVSPLALCEFGGFSLDYYATQFDEAHGSSPRDNMRENLEECLRFAREFPAVSGNLLMMGDAGLGKTHLALSIANEILRRGHEVIYCSAANIFRQIEAEQSTRETTTLDSLKRCELLILDDLGAEYTGFLLNSYLYDIINTRLNQNRPTIYTTNIESANILTSRYGEKVSSRLIGCSRALPFFGDDIRMLKNVD